MFNKWSIILPIIGVVSWLVICLLSSEVRRRFLNFLIAIDQVVYSVVTLGDGSPDETLSAAAYRTERKGKILGKIFRPIIDFLFRPLEREHCYKAYLAEKHGLQLPKEYR